MDKHICCKSPYWINIFVVSPPFGWTNMMQVPFLDEHIDVSPPSGRTNIIASPLLGWIDLMYVAFQDEQFTSVYERNVNNFIVLFTFLPYMYAVHFFSLFSFLLPFPYETRKWSWPPLPPSYDTQILKPSYLRRMS